MLEIMRAFNRVVEYYDDFMEETEHLQAQRRIAQFLAQSNEGLILDVATGIGIMLEPFNFNSIL